MDRTASHGSALWLAWLFLTVLLLASSILIILERRNAKSVSDSGETVASLILERRANGPHSGASLLAAAATPTPACSSAPALAHPRTLFTATDLPHLQQVHAEPTSTTSSTGYGRLAAKLKRTLDRYAPPPPAPTQIVPAVGVAGFAVAARIFDDNPEYLQVARDSLLAVGAGPRDRDLNEATYITNLAVGYDMLSFPNSPLTAQDQQQARTWLGDAAQDMLMAVQGTLPPPYNHPAFWVDDLVQNHNWIDFAALGLAGYTLQGEDCRADAWIQAARDNSVRIHAVQDLVTDGSWHEGVGYESFGLSGELPYWLAARHTDPAYDLDKSQMLAHLGRYILADQAPGNPRVPVLTNGDWNWVRPELVATLQYAANRYQDPYAQQDVQRWEGDTTPATQDFNTDSYEQMLFAALEYVTFDPALTPIDVAMVPLDYYAEDQQAAIMRSGWDSQALVLAFKNGVLGGRGNYERIKTDFLTPHPGQAPFPGGFLNIGHDHIDDLTIWLYGKGGWYLSETPSYNCCFGGDTRYYTTRYHNSFLFDDKGQLGDERNAKLNDPSCTPIPDSDKCSPDDNAVHHAWFFNREASLPLHVSTTDYAFARGDGTGLYPAAANLQALTRTVVLARSGYVVLQDQVRMTAPHQIDQLFHFQQQTTMDGSFWIQGSNDDAQHTLGVRIFSPASPTVVIAPQYSNKCYSLAMPCADDPYNPQAHTYYSVTVRPAAQAASAIFLELLWPTSDWSTRPTTAELDSAKPEVGFRLAQNNGTERWIFNTSNPTEAGGLRITDADLGFVKVASGASGPQQLLLLGLGSLADVVNKRVLLTNPHAPVVEVMLGTGGVLAEVSGSQLEGVAFYAPSSVTDVKANGQLIQWSRQGDMIIIGPGTELTPTATSIASLPASATSTVQERTATKTTPPVVATHTPTTSPTPTQTARPGPPPSGNADTSLYWAAVILAVCALVAGLLLRTRPGRLR